MNEGDHSKIAFAGTQEEIDRAAADGCEVIYLIRDQWEPEPGADYHIFSPSQVDTYLSCRRKWAWRRIARVKTPENASAQLGTEVHSQLEDYLSGKPLDFTHPLGAGYIAAAGIHLLPDPTLDGKSDDEIAWYVENVVIEGEFRFQSARTNFVWNGRKDLEAADSGIFPNITDEIVEVRILPDGSKVPIKVEVDSNGRTGVPCVSDHKSTSGIRWAKTPEDLEYDVQANIYAYALMAFRRVKTVDLIWTYYQTKGARVAKRTFKRMHIAHVARMFRLIEDVAREMAKYVDEAKKLDADGPPDVRRYLKTIPPNPRTCSAYGGCPYRAICQLTIEEEMRASMSDTSWIESLKGRAEAEDGKPLETSSPLMGCAPEAVPAPTELPDWLKGPSSAPAATAPSLPPAPTSAPPPLVPAPTTPAEPSINPPEASAPPPVLPPPPAPPATEATSEEKPKAKRERKSTKKDKDAKGADAAMHTGIDEKKPDGYTVSDQAAQDAIDRAVAACEPDPSVFSTTRDKTATPDPTEGFTLYIDCFPIGVPASTAEVYIGRAQDWIRSQDWPDGAGTKKVGDYRFIGFGQGPGVLANAVLVEVEKDPPSHLVVSTRTPEGQAIVTSLAAKADLVVRGLA